MQVTCLHCSHSFEHEAPAYASASANAVCPSCGRDTPAGGDWASLEGDPAAAAGGESRVYCFNCGKAMQAREGELIPVCDECRQDRAADVAEDPTAPAADEPIADWMIRKANNNVYGPFPAETIVEWIKARKILPDEEVAHIGGAWRLFSQHEEFGGYFEKPAGGSGAPAREEVDFRHRNPVKTALVMVAKIAAGLALVGGLSYGVYYAFSNETLVVSEGAVDSVVNKVSDLTAATQSRTGVTTSEDAGKLLMELVTRYPDASGTSMERFLRGRTLMLRDNLPNFDLAKVELEQAVVLDPGNTLALAGLAELYNLLAYQGYGNLDLQRYSIYLLQLAEAQETFTAEVLRARSSFLVYSGNLAEGKSRLLDALNQNPSDPELHFLMGIATRNAEKGQTAESLKNFEKALELDPNYHQVYYELARGEEESGNLREAIAAYSKKLELDRRSALSHVRLGGIYEEIGERRKAMAQYDSAIAINPKQKAGVLRRAVLASQVEGKHARAATLLRGLWEETRGVDLRIAERKEVGGHLAGALRLSGDNDAALAVAEELLQEDKTYGPALFHKGMALVGLGRIDDALPSLNRTDEADLTKRERAVAKFQVGLANKKAGRQLDAQEAFGSAADFDPTFVPAYIWRAGVSLEVGSARSAAKELLSHIDNDPLEYRRARILSAIYEPLPDARAIGDRFIEEADKAGFGAELLAAAGVAFFHSGAVPAAKAAFTRAVDEEERNAASLFYLGLLEFDRGRMDVAGKQLTKLIEVVGNEPIYLIYLAETQHVRKQVPAAIATYERGLGYGRLKSAWAHSRFAATLAANGEEDRARAEIDKAMSLDPAAIEPRRSAFQFNL